MNQPASTTTRTTMIRTTTIRTTMSRTTTATTATTTTVVTTATTVTTATLALWNTCNNNNMSNNSNNQHQLEQLINICQTVAKQEQNRPSNKICKSFKCRIWSTTQKIHCSGIFFCFHIFFDLERVFDYKLWHVLSVQMQFFWAKTKKSCLYYIFPPKTMLDGRSTCFSCPIYIEK